MRINHEHISCGCSGHVNPAARTFPDAPRTGIVAGRQAWLGHRQGRRALALTHGKTEESL
ncbi:hypothetical protein BDI4_830086 [Burkholderia diffusa]|nr:hypothetical protein BDI4_830086 [Burkholderia diffusa]